MSAIPSILFLCTGNSCRSQMAEGLANHMHSGKLSAYSAGIEAHGLNPYAVQVMEEAGIYISNNTSKRLDELALDFDYIVTVCDHANQHCPAFPDSAQVIHHSFENPPELAKHAKTEQEKLACYQAVREQIKQFVQTLPDILHTSG